MRNRLQELLVRLAHELMPRLLKVVVASALNPQQLRLGARPKNNTLGRVTFLHFQPCFTYVASGVDACSTSSAGGG